MIDPTTVSVGFGAGVIWRALLLMVVNQDWAWRRFLRWSAGADVHERADVKVILAGIRCYRNRLPPQMRPSEKALGPVTLPILALFGGRSVVHNGRRAAERAQDLWPHAEIELWPEAGHDMSLLDGDRERIDQRVLDFVKRHSA
jgi:hypothetical protein